MKFELSSPELGAGKAVPLKYTCDGENVSPPLEWNKPPPGTQSLVLVVDDPGAPKGIWTHWVVYNIPPTMRHLPEKFHATSQNVMEARNSYNNAQYDGPCPPSGSAHIYHFKLFALDKKLELPIGATHVQVARAMNDHVIATAGLTGTYSRQAAQASR